MRHAALVNNPSIRRRWASWAGGSLARRYAVQVGVISGALLSVAGLVEGAFSYRQARAQMAQLQAVQAHAAAREIEQYLQALAEAVRQVQQLPWGERGFGPQQRREELHRLLALNPAIISFGDHDAEGRERLFVSRNQLDRLDNHRAGPGPVRPDGEGFGSARFDDQGVPNIVLGTRFKRADGAFTHTVATINLRFLADVVSGLRLPDEGKIYIVDESARLLAHPDPTLALRQVSLASHPPLLAARRAFAARQPLLEATDAPGLGGGDAITSAARMRDPQWLVFVEQPRARALAPALATLERTLLLLAVGGGAALIASLVSARRMAAPIARLREATAGLAAGSLGTQLQVHSGDEIELLANDFNAMSARLEQSYKVLEDRVEERTASLRLRSEEAERANADKSLYLRVVSHDLRQPLHGIGLLTGVLLAQLSDAGATRLAGQLQQAVQAMDRLFNALLQVSNLDAGGVTPRPVRVSLQDVLQTAQHAHGSLAAAKGLVLRVRPTRESVYTDATLLTQVVINLCANAVRYTAQGGVLLACRRRGDTVVLQVFDTGIGIPEDQSARIFDEFVRLRQVPGDADGGLGMGLAFVKRAAALLGLGIGVVSRPGRGSRFEVTLPALAQPVARTGEAAPTAADLAALTDAFVLLVDEQAAQRHATALALRQAGCLVETAGSAESALAVAGSILRVPDAIVIALDSATAIDGSRANPGRELVLLRQLQTALGERVPALLLMAAPVPGCEAVEGVLVLERAPSALQLMRTLARLLPPAPAATGPRTASEETPAPGDPRPRPPACDC